MCGPIPSYDSSRKEIDCCGDSDSGVNVAREGVDVMGCVSEENVVQGRR